MMPVSSPPLGAGPGEILTGTGKLSWLSSEAGLIRSDMGVISFQLKEFCDQAVNDLTLVLHPGFILKFQALAAPGLNYSVDGQAQWVATFVAPVHGPEAKQLANGEVNLEAPPGVETGPPHLTKEPYFMELESKAVRMLLSVFKQNSQPQCQLGNFHCHISICGDEELYSYVGTSRLKRRQFLERRTHLFNINSDDVVSLQPAAIYITVITLTKQLLIRGGACLVEELFDHFTSCPEISPEARDMIGEGKGHFIRFLKAHPWIFSVFPSGLFVSVRRNLLDFDYSAFISEHFSGYDSFTSRPNGDSMAPIGVLPTEHTRQANQQQQTANFCGAGGRITRFTDVETQTDGQSALKTDACVQTMVEMKSTGCEPEDEPGNEPITDKDETSLYDESTSSSDNQSSSGSVALDQQSHQLIEPVHTNFPHYELHNSSVTKGFMSGSPAPPCILSPSMPGLPTDEPHLHQQQLATPTFANGVIMSNGISSTASSSYGSGSNLSLASPTPLQNDQSPFLNASDHVIDKIFRTLSAHGIELKMHMELVCRRFQSRIRRRSSWQGETDLKLEHQGGLIFINGYKFTFEKAHLALSKLLDRIQVEELVFSDTPGIPLNVLLDVCHTITQHKDFINLKDIQIWLHFSTNIDYSPLLTSLTDCGLEILSRLEFGDGDRDCFEYLPHYVCSMLSHCPNLKTLFLGIKKNWPIWDLFLESLSGCHHITDLCIDSEDDVTHQNAIEFAQFCSSNFPKLTMLSFNPFNIDHFVPLDFTNALGEQLRSNITKFSIYLDAEIDTQWQFLATCCNWFPKLKTLVLDDDNFPTATILELIGNIFANYSHAGTDIYKFELAVNVENEGEVLSKLAQKRWNEVDELVKIAASDGIWTCAKNNVQITFLGFGDDDDNDDGI